MYRKPKREINRISHIDHNKTILRKRGFRLFKGWDQHCPSLLGTDADNQRIAYDWEDHCYMLKNKEVPTVYVTEPYPEHVEGETFMELAELVKDGWHVQISEGLSLHNPGRTIPIWITQNCVITDYNLLDSYTNCRPDCDMC